MSTPNLTVEHIGDNVAEKQIKTLNKQYANKYAGLTNIEKLQLKKAQEANAVQAAVKKEGLFGLGIFGLGGSRRKSHKHSASRKQRTRKHVRKHTQKRKTSLSKRRL